MIESDVIIVGGGPAGSACAARLAEAGISVRILDKQSFPRTKLCAGWVTPQVLADLSLSPDTYPHRLITFSRIVFAFFGVPVPLPTRQHSIRRYEFDDFLLKRAGVPVHRHAVKQIRRENGGYVIDDAFFAKSLVGAGGTHCPVYKALFKDRHPRDDTCRITTVEEEFSYEYRDPTCRLWFFEDGLPGYAWYVPKENGYVNVGIGAKAAGLKKRGRSINEYWHRFTEKLARQNLVTGHRFSPRGHLYFLRQPATGIQYENAFITGDAAGLATVDMGEGIGPAVQSGQAAAEAIINGRPYTIDHIGRFSAPQILGARWFRPRRRHLSKS